MQSNTFTEYNLQFPINESNLQFSQLRTQFNLVKSPTSTRSQVSKVGTSYSSELSTTQSSRKYLVSARLNLHLALYLGCVISILFQFRLVIGLFIGRRCLKSACLSLPVYLFLFFMVNASSCTSTFVSANDK